MVQPKDRGKAKKFKRLPSGKVKVLYVREKPGKHHCSLCRKVMHGLPHGKTRAEVSKLSKTQKRPEALLAGTLCNQCRQSALDEAIKVRVNLKSLDDVALNVQPFVKVLMNKLE